MKVSKNHFNKKVFWFVILIVLSLISISTGITDFSLIKLLQGQQEDIFILQISRLPRLISTIVTGASLGVAGIIMQTITRNKFVSPSTIGTMEWCRLGIVFVLIVIPNASTTLKTLVAFIFSFFGTLLFIKIINNLKYKNDTLLPLIGIMLGSVISSITSFIAYQTNIIQNISSWLQGSFSLIIKGRYELLYIGIPALIIAYIYADKFTIAGMGDSFSKNLGLDYKKITMLGLMIVAFITSIVVSTVGTIPFVGLIVPNIVSMYRGDNLKKSIGEVALVGSCFVLACDIIGRLIIAPFEISISVIISVIGSFIFLLIIFRRSNYE